MILPIAFLLGALFGWMRASKRGGNRLDKLQYAAGHGIAFLLLALLATLALDRMGIV
jgi:hypothetical protein